MSGSSIGVLMLEDGLEQKRAMLAAIARGESVAAFEARRRRKDGTLIYVSIRLSPLIERDAVVGGSKVVRDITERKQMEAATRRANAHLTNTNKTNPDAFALYDEQDHVVMVN